MSVPGEQTQQLRDIFGKKWRYTIWEKLNEYQSEVKCRKSVAGKWGQTVIPHYWQWVLARHTKFVMDDDVTERSIARSLKFITERNKHPKRNQPKGYRAKGYRDNAAEREQRREYQLVTRALCGEKAARWAATEDRPRVAV